MNYTQEQLDKLPKWAKSEIKALEFKVSRLEGKLKQLEGEGETNTYIVEGLSQKPLPNNSQVEFRTGAKQEDRVTVYIRRDGTVDVNTDSRMGKEMVILPRASNSFYITFIKG